MTVAALGSTDHVKSEILRDTVTDLNSEREVVNLPIQFHRHPSPEGDACFILLPSVPEQSTVLNVDLRRVTRLFD